MLDCDSSRELEDTAKGKGRLPSRRRGLYSRSVTGTNLWSDLDSTCVTDTTLGNPFAPLSYLSFSVPPLPDDLQSYQPDTDLIQLGEGFEVVPVPFTVSPLGLLDRLREEVGRRTTWNGVRFDESKWTEQLVRIGL